MKNPQRWQKWLVLLVAVGLLAAAVIQAGLPGRQVGAIACLWLSVVVLLQVFRLRDREELAHELSALRRELEQLRDWTNEPGPIWSNQDAMIVIRWIRRARDEAMAAKKRATQIGGRQARKRPQPPAVNSEELSQLFGGHKVDMVQENYLSRWLRAQVLASAEVRYAEG